MDFEEEMNPDMDLQQATLEMARLLKKEKDFHTNHISILKDDQEIPQETLKEFEKLRAITREFGNQIAAIPHFFNILESWKVNLSGKATLSQAALNEAYKDGDIDALVEKSGNLAIIVKDFIKKEGFYICDMGAGATGWDISVRCTEKQSKELCIRIFQRFNQALRMGLLVVSRRFAGHRIPGLYNWDDAERYLSFYGDQNGNITI